MDNFSEEFLKTAERLEELKNCQEALGYRFNDISLLNTALTHNSFANENNKKSYQRLEFLGDSVVSLVVSTGIYNKFGKLPEGSLTKLRASLVCEKTLADLSLRYSLEKYVLLGKGEEKQGGRNKSSILADIFESVTGAVYLDGGFAAVERFLGSKMEGLFDSFEKIYQNEDHKTNLQEYAAAKHLPVQYEVVTREGPDHDSIFTVRVTVADRSALGTGKSKKDAQQEAARIFLQNEEQGC